MGCRPSRSRHIISLNLGLQALAGTLAGAHNSVSRWAQTAAPWPPAASITGSLHTAHARPGPRANFMQPVSHRRQPPPQWPLPSPATTRVLGRLHAKRQARVACRVLAGRRRREEAAGSVPGRSAARSAAARTPPSPPPGRLGNPQTRTAGTRPRRRP